MKVKTLSILAAVAGTMLCAQPTQAGLTGMRLDLVNSAGGVDTYRLIGEFASANDRVDAIAGTALNPFTLDVSGGIINSASDLAGGAGNADKAFATSVNGDWDTYMSLGDIAGPTTFSPIGGWSPDPFGIIDGETGTKILTDGLTFISSTNVGFFQAGGRDVGTSDDAVATDFIFMQISVVSGTAFSINGQINGVNEDTTAFGDGFFVEVVPAPGAIALLGLAGLVGRPRRRRA